MFIAFNVNAASWQDEPTEAIVGIHLLSDYGSRYQFLSTDISATTVEEAVRKIDWKHGFYQVVVVLTPGVSMEVGGSDNSIDGFSVMYRNRHNRIEAVIVSPPTTSEAMAEILMEFIKGGNLICIDLSSIQSKKCCELMICPVL